MRKPYWRKSAKAWYVNLNGRQVRLGKEKETAFAEYHKIMADPSVIASGPRLTVEVLLDLFLVWTKAIRSERTFQGHLYLLQSFAGIIGPKLRCARTHCSVALTRLPSRS
jgi:hypothetical protein